MLPGNMNYINLFRSTNSHLAKYYGNMLSQHNPLVIRVLFKRVCVPTEHPYCVHNRVRIVVDGRHI